MRDWVGFLNCLESNCFFHSLNTAALLPGCAALLWGHNRKFLFTGNIDIYSHTKYILADAFYSLPWAYNPCEKNIL